ncbi:MAG: hypothetical protein K6E69_09125 [Treponema sp.]|nr:hypothetical protein [Treponema sp.]
MSGAFSPPTHAPDCLMGMAGPDPAFFFNKNTIKELPKKKKYGARKLLLEVPLSATAARYFTDFTKITILSTI